MAGWHHRLNGHEFEQALGFGDGQGPWGSKELNMTEQLNTRIIGSGFFTSRATRGFFIPLPAKPSAQSGLLIPNTM